MMPSQVLAPRLKATRRRPNGSTLEHASQQPYVSEYPDEHVYTHLAEIGELLPCDVEAAGEQFSAMIAAALRKIMTEKLPKKLLQHIVLQDEVSARSKLSWGRER